ncbi:MAG: alpha-glucosidase [Sphaerochaeta sp.]|uniref:alpha-glucosidase n=1 Tax=Sphaerochaeta sp. TaxID=1972642 RepID=UPI0025852659|nr:alpha-glucosidase [Sphaerochaeta sp.]MDD4038753.1 alpha-glucosidase [Sphaerochaeta sp.]
MIDIQTNQDSFILSHNEVPVLQHSKKSPCIGIGQGSCTITMPHGMYHIKDESLSMWKEPSRFSVDESKTKEGTIHITFGDLVKLTIHEEPFGLRIIPTVLTSEVPNRFHIRLPLLPEDPIFGCGEQFSHLDLRGKILPLWVSEPGIGRGPNYVKVLANLHSGRGGSQEHTYFPQPSFVTASGRWALMQTTAFCRFDFSQKDSCTLLCHDIPSSIYVGQAGSIPTAVGALSSLLGRQEILPDWAFDGIILGLQGGRSVVEAKLKRALDAGIPVTAIWCQDWQGIRITPYGKQLFWNWQYDQQLYPDLPRFIEELHERGVKFLGYNNPFLSTDAPLYAEGERKGYFIRQKHSSLPYITSTTTFPVALVDLCNPAACLWYKQIIKENMLAIDLDGWMADFGEYLPPDGELFDNMDPYLEHNRYPVRWAQLNAQAVQEAGKGNEIVYFCRSGFTGSSNNVPLFWAGDQAVNFLADSGLPSVVRAAISSALSGIGYWHFDIGGFFSFAWIKRSRELLMRSCETAAFTAVMRTHEGINPRVNAQFDDDQEMLSHFARMARIHQALLFYHQHVSEQYQKEGIPPIMPVLVQKHRVAQGQYFYGQDLLVAPVLKKGARKRRVWLPEGKWIHFFTGQVYNEGRYAIRADIGSIPVFIRSTSPFLNLFREIAQKESM